VLARRLAKLFADDEKDLPKNSFALAAVELQAADAASAWSRSQVYLKQRSAATRNPALDLGTDIVFWGPTVIFGDTSEAHDSLFEEPRLVVVNRFGKFLTVDRREIEEYTSLHNVFQNYLRARDWTKPLCVAVFGPPGSGKGFAVQQILASIQDKPEEPLEFNVAQMNDLNDLMRAFHAVQTAGSPVPALSPRLLRRVRFRFDGTTSAPQVRPRPHAGRQVPEEEHTYHIGRVILVFAGGVNHTFDKFRTSGKDGSFEAAKGPDFISRLRGYLNVGGPNRPEGARTMSSFAAPPPAVPRNAMGEIRLPVGCAHRPGRRPPFSASRAMSMGR
jgi:hypothetical protein